MTTSVVNRWNRSFASGTPSRSSWRNLKRLRQSPRIAQLDKQIELLQAQQNDGVRKEVDRLVNTAKSSADRVKTKPSKAAEDSKASRKQSLQRSGRPAVPEKRSRFEDVAY